MLNILSRLQHQAKKAVILFSILILFISCGGGDGSESSNPGASPVAEPAAPSQLRSGDITDSLITLTWNDQSDNETGFEIQRSDDGVSFITVHTTEENTTNYTDTGLTPTHTYHYRVKAVNSSGDSGYTAVIEVSTLAAPVVNTPWNPDDFSSIYDVGPGHPYETPSDVPWENLQSSSLVRIYYRAEPYRDKWVITTTAEADNPVVVTGIPDNGRLPVISGEDAVTRSSLYYLNQVRSIVKIGNYTSENDTDNPAHVYLENLDIRTARPGYYFTDTNGQQQQYNRNAAAVHIEDGINITLRNCRLHDCGNAIMSTYISKNVLISSNHIYDNGIEDSYYEHNTYTHSQGITYEYNHFGPLRSGCGGNNLKDRSSGTVIRYNWIESGNRQLDLVDSNHSEVYNSISYDETFVYGNILVEPDGAGNSQIIHYGGDSYDHYRRGILYLYNNTIVSTRTGNTTLIRLSTDDVTADIRNNIIYTSASPGHLALTNGQGIVHLSGNWLTETYRDSFESTSPDIMTDEENITGTDPGFVDAVNKDFHIAGESECINKAVVLSSETTAYPVNRQYVKHQSGEIRTVNETLSDTGAYESDE